MRYGWRANCLIDENASDRGFDSPAKSLREIICRHRRSERDAGTMLEHHCTEPAAKRGSNGWASGLYPAQPQPRPCISIPHDRPGHGDFAGLGRNGTIFQRVRGKRMNCQPYGFRRGGQQDKVHVPVEVNFRCYEVGDARKLARDQCSHPRAGPVAPDEQVLIGGKRLQAHGKAFRELLVGGPVHDSLDDRHHFLGARARARAACRYSGDGMQDPSTLTNRCPACIWDAVLAKLTLDHRPSRCKRDALPPQQGEPLAVGLFEARE